MVDKDKLSTLWNGLAIEVVRFHECVKEHSKSVFLGYADVTVSVTTLPGMIFKIKGIGVKILKGSPYLDFPSERGADGTYYPICFPLSPELRRALTVGVFSSPEVTEVVAQGREQQLQAEHIECAIWEEQMAEKEEVPS